MQVAVQIALETSSGVDDETPAVGGAADTAEVGPANVSSCSDESEAGEVDGRGKERHWLLPGPSLFEIGDCPFGAGDAKQRDQNGKLLRRGDHICRHRGSTSAGATQHAIYGK